MFKPVAMQRVELSLLREHASSASLLLASFGSFDPEVSTFSAAELPELPGDDYRQTYVECRARLDKILDHYGIRTPPPPATSLHTVEHRQLKELEVWLKNIWQQCSSEQESLRSLRDERRRSSQLLKGLGQFMDLNIDLALLRKDSRVLDIRVGILPRANLQRFTEALALAGYIAIDFYTNPEHVHLIIAGPIDGSSEVASVLQSAGWRSTDIPQEFRGRPDEVRQQLNRRIAELDRQQADLLQRSAATLEELHTRLLAAEHDLMRAAPFAELAMLMRGRGELVTVSGWVPQDSVPHLREMLIQRFASSFYLQARDPAPDESAQVPSMIRHHPWLRPFASLVLNYGVPRYGEIDPTLLFAVTFVLMFGMMFGDVGQGAVIALAGFAFRRRLGQYAPFAIAAGISSSIFGFLYGSVFGFEHVLPALWMAPLSDPLRLLGVALGCGIAFIALATLLSIRNRIAEGRLQEALYGSHGAAGLLLYLALVFGGYRYAGSAAVDGFTVLVALAALATMLRHTWRHNRTAPVWERSLVALMEGFETLLAYISNTLSFLRVAAFSLNHVALTVAIFTVGSMMQPSGYWVSVVLGNLFILVLEGAIVAIQTLRLEYYEGFSRFFGGDGRPFQPLVLGGRKELAAKLGG